MNAQVKPWEPMPKEMNAARSALASRLLHWLAQSQVQEYTSEKGYRFLIIDAKGRKL